MDGYDVMTMAEAAPLGDIFGGQYRGEFMAIGVYGQWMYADPSRQIIIVKTSADPDFMSQDYELKHVEFFRAIAGGLL